VLKATHFVLIHNNPKQINKNQNGESFEDTMNPEGFSFPGTKPAYKII
jgi:hypothetical protein